MPVDIRFYKIEHEPGGEPKCKVISGSNARDVDRRCVRSSNLERMPVSSRGFDIPASILFDFLATSQFAVRFWSKKTLSIAELTVHLHQNFSVDLTEKLLTGIEWPHIVAGESVRRWLAAQGVDVEPRQEEIQPTH